MMRIKRCSHCGCDEPIHNDIDGKLYCNNCGMRLEDRKEDVKDAEKSGTGGRRMKIKARCKFDICDLTYAEFKALRDILSWYEKLAGEDVTAEEKRVMALFDKRMGVGIPTDTEVAINE